jgi:dTDP-4-dehydrorhamnose reductase
MKILVTGANGQVGKEIVWRGNVAGDYVAAFDSTALDITDTDAVFNVITHYQPQVVINAAAYTAVDRAEQEPQRAYLVNRDGPKHLAATCSRCGIPLLHISTDYVFNGRQQEAYREDAAAAPLGIYGDSKWQGEQAVRELLEQHFILRVSWVFSRHGNNFVKTMLRMARQQERLTVVADQLGCPTYAGDIADTLLQLARKTPFSQISDWGTYHYAGLPAVSWYTFATSIIDLARTYECLAVKEVVPISTVDYPVLAERPVNSILDCRLLQDKFGITPRFWRDGLDQTVSALMRGAVTVA